MNTIIISIILSFLFIILTYVGTFLKLSASGERIWQSNLSWYQFFLSIQLQQCVDPWTAESLVTLNKLRHLNFSNKHTLLHIDKYFLISMCKFILHRFQNVYFFIIKYIQTFETVNKATDFFSRLMTYFGNFGGISFWQTLQSSSGYTCFLDMTTLLGKSRANIPMRETI